MRQKKEERSFSDSSRVKLIRGADGRLRRAEGEGDIGDLWADQRRIQLREAIQEDERKAEKKSRKDLLKRLKKHPKNGESAEPSSSGSREFVLQLNMPKIHAAAALKRLWERTPKKTAAKIAGVLGVVILIFFVLPNLVSLSHKHGAGDKKGNTGVLDTKTVKPSYHTVLPEHKSIDQLGGWARVSPPDRDPVYAFTDNIDGVHIIVSEQPLPDSFKKDAGAVAQLAEQYSATTKLSVKNTTAYLGTSIKGPQSVIVAQYDLLILIKSDTKISNDKWVDYIYGLDQPN